MYEGIDWLYCDGCGEKRPHDDIFSSRMSKWNWFPSLPDHDTRHYCPECRKGKPYRDAWGQYKATRPGVSFDED
jgi:hypothetical protein